MSRHKSEWKAVITRTKVGHQDVIQDAAGLTAPERILEDELHMRATLIPATSRRWDGAPDRGEED